MTPLVIAGFCARDSQHCEILDRGLSATPGERFTRPHALVHLMIRPESAPTGGTPPTSTSSDYMRSASGTRRPPGSHVCVVRMGRRGGGRFDHLGRHIPDGLACGLLPGALVAGHELHRTVLVPFGCLVRRRQQAVATSRASQSRTLCWRRRGAGSCLGGGGRTGLW